MDSKQAPALTRGHKKKERTRSQLVSAAVAVMSERGEAFTISDVAHQAHVSNGTFYNYFDDRDQLIDAVAAEIVETFASEGALVFSDDGPVLRFTTLSMLAIAKARTAPDAMGALVRLDAVRSAVFARGPLRFLADDLAAGADEGSFDFGSLDAALDLVVGSLLMAVRRAAAGDIAADHDANVVGLLLVALGLDRATAAITVERAQLRLSNRSRTGS